MAIVEAGTRIANPRPAKNRPAANFAGLEGSRPRSDTHNHANTGANAMMNSGCTDWNQLAGNRKPRTSRLVFRSANKLREDPAGSKADQNTAARGSGSPWH